MFNIIETNQFKALVHLSLKFREANDLTLKQYLAGRLVNEKSANEDLRLRVERLEDSLNMRGVELEALQNEYKKLQADKEQKMEEIRNTEGRKLNEHEYEGEDNREETVTTNIDSCVDVRGQDDDVVDKANEEK